jgi:hypothetical protein
MQTSPVTASPMGAPAARVTPSAVSAGALQRANIDGDSRTGAAAFDDGDAVVRAAAQQVRSARPTVDIKAETRICQPHDQRQHWPNGLGCL